jgi:hypothetical protein
MDKDGIINDVNRFQSEQDNTKLSSCKIILSLFSPRYIRLSSLVISLWMCNTLSLFTNLYSLPIILNKREINFSQNYSRFPGNNFLKPKNESNYELPNQNMTNYTVEPFINSTSYNMPDKNAEEKIHRHNEIKKILIANIIPLPAEFLAGLLTGVPLLGRKYTMAIGFLFQSLFAIMMFVHPIYLHIYSSLIVSFNVLSFNICKLYTCEAFNTDIRDNAYGFSNFCSRIAAVFIPLIANYFLLYSTYGPCFFISTVCILGFVLCLFLPFDTFNRPLDSRDIKDSKLKK